MVHVRIPATTANMGPGFDCMGMALGLYNQVWAEITPNGLVVENSGNEAANMPTDESHLVVKCMRTLFQHVGWKPDGLRVRVHSDIPVSRGLGSSAACIVGGLVAANTLAGKPLTTEQLLEMAVQLEGHPDNVAPALLGGIVVSACHGKKTSYVRFPVPEAIQCLTAIPDVSLSTAKAREALPALVSFEDAVFNVGKASLLVAALMQEDYHVLQQAFEDRLHQPYRIRLLPPLLQVFNRAREKNVRTITVSGAGPTLVYFVFPGSDARCQDFVDILHASSLKWEMIRLKGDNVGAVVETQ